MKLYYYFKVWQFNYLQRKFKKRNMDNIMLVAPYLRELHREIEVLKYLLK